MYSTGTSTGIAYFLAVEVFCQFLHCVFFLFVSCRVTTVVTPKERMLRDRGVLLPSPLLNDGGL